MVMHASKLPRLSDGFHDRNEAHPYQTSVDKYPSKSLNAGGTNSEHGSGKDRDREKSQLHPQHREMPASGMRHTASPSTGSSRPGSESGSPRTYRNKSSYLQRQRDRQQRGSSTSPAENTFNHQSHHGSNSNSSDPQNSHEKHIKTILAKASEWSEHISSSGKKYYYNCKTEVSQWEKPKEWIERERLKRVVHEKIPAKDSPKPVHNVDSRQTKSSNEKHSSDSNRDRPTSHQSHTTHGSDRHSHDSSSHSVSSRRQEEYYSGSRSHEKSSSNTSSRESKPSTTTSSSSTSGSNNNSGGHGHSSRSTPSRSTPSSTPTQSPYGRSQHHQQLYHQTEGGHRNRTEHKGHEILKSPGSGPSPGPSPSPGHGGGLQMGGSSLSLATDMYGRLKSLVPVQQGSKNEKLESPRVQGTPSPGPVNASPITPKPHTTPNQHSLHPPSAAHRLFPSSHSPSVDKNAATTIQATHPHSQQQGDRTDSGHDRLSNPSPMSIDSVSDLSSPAPSQTDPSPRPQLTTPVSQQQQSYSSQTSVTSTATVTQAQNSLGTSISTSDDAKQSSQTNQQSADLEDGRPPQASPTLSRKSVSPTHSVSSQSGQVTPHKSPAAIAAALASTPLKPITATITPSLVQHFDESLTRHGHNWPADHAERQATRFGEESLTLGAEYSSQISVDLKFARSLVRASEIQATLQEQRILFLRQQAKDLEKLKSENAYMT